MKRQKKVAMTTKKWIKEIACLAKHAKEVLGGGGDLCSGGHLREKMVFL